MSRSCCFCWKRILDSLQKGTEHSGSVVQVYECEILKQITYSHILQRSVLLLIQVVTWGNTFSLIFSQFWKEQFTSLQSLAACTSNDTYFWAGWFWASFKKIFNLYLIIIFKKTFLLNLITKIRLWLLTRRNTKI